MANGVNVFSDLEEIRTFLQERVRIADPTIDISSGSSFNTVVIDPLIERLGPDPYDTPILDYIRGRLRVEFPDLILQEGDALDDYAVKIMVALLEPMRRQIQQVSNNQSFANPDVLSEDEADRLGANFFITRRQGGYAIGVARLYFSSPQYAIVNPSNQLFTASDLVFYPVETQAISSQSMIFNLEGSLYYFDIIARARDQGSDYNIEVGELIGISGIPQVVKVVNKAKFSEGDDRETTETYVDRISSSLTEKSLVTLRGITARVLDIFDSVKSLQVIGFGDPEMGRDIVTGTDSFSLYARFVGVATGSTIALVGIADGDTDHDDFTAAGVRVGDRVTRYDMSTQEKWEGVVVSVTASSMTVDSNPPDQSTSVGYDLLSPLGLITLSDIPGGILNPTTPYGEVVFGSGDVHIGGALDVFVRAGFPQDRNTIVESIRDESPLHFGLDLESFGGDDDEFAFLTSPITDSMAIPSTDQYGNVLTARLELLLDIDSDTVGWHPTDSDVGRFVEFLDDGLASNHGIHEIVSVEGEENPSVVTLTFTVSPGTAVGDTGKDITDATNGSTGTLLGYDNVAKTWEVRKTGLSDHFDSGDSVSVDGGTGSGTLAADHSPKVAVRVTIGTYNHVPLFGDITDLDETIGYTQRFRLLEKVSVKGRVRDRDNSRVPVLHTRGPGIDFGDLGVAIGDSVVIETGDDSGIYTVRRILDSISTGDLLILDRDLTKTLEPSGLGDQTGLRYRVADELNLDLVEPRVTKIPLGDIFAGDDLNTVAGSRTVLVGSSTNFLLAGVAEGDVLEVLGGDDVGRYIVTTVTGTSAILDTAMQATATGVDFRVYTAFTGVARPLVRVKSIELLDSNSNPTGITIPYGKQIDCRVSGRLSNREAGDLLESYSGTANLGNNRIVETDPDKDFVDAGVQAGDRVTILEGPNSGDYTIEAVATTYVDLIPASEGGKDLVSDSTSFRYIAGVPSGGYVRVYFMEPTSFEIDTGILGGRLESEDGKEFRFSEVEGFPILPEPASDDDNPRDMKVVQSYLVGPDYETVVELTSDSHPDVFGMELKVGDVVEVWEQIPFNDSSGDSIKRDLGVVGEMVGLRTLSGSNRITIPSSSLVDFTQMSGLVGAHLYIESGPDAGQYTIEEVVDSKTLRLDRIMSGTAEGSVHETTPRDGHITVSGGDVVLIDPTDYHLFGSQVGNFITIFESIVPGIEGTYEITDITPPTIKIDAPNITESIPAGSFGWFRATSEGDTQYPYHIYKSLPVEYEILEVAVKEADITPAYADGEILAGLDTIQDTVNSPFGPVAVGDRLEVLFGDNAGVYTVKLVTGAPTYITIYGAFVVEESDVFYRVWGGAHGSTKTLRVGPKNGSDGLIFDGYQQPYRIVRPSVYRMSSTEMMDSSDGTLYYADLQIESEGAGDAFNLADRIRMEVTSGIRVEGYVYDVGNNNLTFSPYEEVGLTFARRFLPAGNSDSPDNMSEISGRSLQINFQSSTITGLIDRLLRSETERPVCANPIARHFLPSYLYIYFQYSGGGSQSLVVDDLEEYVNNMSPIDELEVSDLEAFISRRGATYIRHPIELVSLTHDIDRSIVVERSYDKIGGLTVPYNGTARISSFFAREDEGLKVDKI